MRRRGEPTPFACAVYDRLRKIPPGRVMSYGALARWVGCGSARAVGRVLGANPFAPEVPCHRVVAMDGSLCGFKRGADVSALADKRALLEREGVIFQPDGRVAATCFWMPWDG